MTAIMIAPDAELVVADLPRTAGQVFTVMSMKPQFLFHQRHIHDAWEMTRAVAISFALPMHWQAGVPQGLATGMDLLPQSSRCPQHCDWLHQRQ